MGGREALTKQLGGNAPPKGLVDTVGDADLEHLAGVVREARRLQAEALSDGAEHALRFVPALLRRPFKKVLRI